jgi:uncharacterized protein
MRPAALPRCKTTGIFGLTHAPIKSAERNLSMLLASIQPVMRPETYVFCTVTADRGIPEGVTPVSIFREQEGTALIVTLADAETAGLPYQFLSRMITLNAFSALDAVGFLAAVTARLAAAGISVNPVSAYYHDHLFVPVDRADDAMRLLASA